MAKEDYIFQLIVTNTIAFFDAHYANKAVHSNLTRQLLIDKWLTNKRIKVTTTQILGGVHTSCTLKLAKNSETSLSFYNQVECNDSYKYIIHWAEEDALDSIIRRFKNSQNVKLQKRMDRLISLMKDVIGNKMRYNNEFKSLIVEYACKKKGMESVDYEAFVKRIKGMDRENNLNGVLAGALTVMIARMFA